MQFEAFCICFYVRQLEEMERRKKNTQTDDKKRFEQDQGYSNIYAFISICQRFIAKRVAHQQKKTNAVFYSFVLV